MIDKARTQNLVERIISPNVQALKAYQVVPAEGMVKLDAMENPYRWPTELVHDWSRLLVDVELNRYPDPDPQVLKEALARAAEVPDGMAMLLGNGSDELIQILQTGCIAADRCVLALEPGFVMYELIARSLGMEFVSVALQADFSLSVDDMLKAMQRHLPVLTFIAYPNNPTANLFDSGALEKVIEAAPGLVVIDEAYSPFAGSTMMACLERFPNLLLLRTLSKMGLAGLRLGYLVGAPQWIEQFNKVRLPYNVGALTQATALFVLEHLKVFERQAEEICKNRDLLIADLKNFNCFEVFPSNANFLLFRTRPGEAIGIYQRLKEAGVLIKLITGASSLLSDCLRVTVGSAEENRVFLAALRKAV